MCSFSLHIGRIARGFLTQPASMEASSNNQQHFESVVAMAQKNHTAKLQKLKHYIESFCGIYSRIARHLGVDRTYVSRVANGERHSPEVEAALVREFDRTQEKSD